MDDVVLRPAVKDDLEAIAGLFTRSRRLLSFLPDLNSEKEDQDFIETAVMRDHEVTVALCADSIVGFIATGDGWVDHLYIHPDHIRHGVGSRLLRSAMNGAGGLKLWTFQKNEPARAFYERHGFLPARLTDGHGNAEREPDVLYVWLPDAA